MEVRPARAAEWQMLRELRMRALADAPDAFSNTLEEAAALPEQVWRQWAQGGPASVDFIAWEGNVGVGMAAIFAVDDAPGRMQLVAMWVDPRHRRQGVARALVERAVRWAEERQAREVILWVADHNLPARMLYERVGFRPTGRRQPLPSNPVLSESLLRLPLTRPTAGYSPDSKPAQSPGPLGDPTGSCPALFLALSASPVSKP